MTLGFPVEAVAVFVVLAGAVWLYDVMSCRYKNRPLTFAESVSRSLLYIAVALAYGGYLLTTYGVDVFTLFLSGYVMEKVLSVDNLIVFAAVFTYFRVPLKDQPWILQYGIVGAIVFRLIFITVGVGSLLLFGWITELVFGLLVAWSAYGLYKAGEEGETDYESTWFVKLARRCAVRPELVCLVAIEITDVLFAFDSVPAVIAITQEPLLIFSAMLFAVLGLRALYFVLAALREYLVHLDTAVLVVLVFISAKLVGHALFGWHVGPVVSCSLVLGILSLGVLASFIKPVAYESH